MTKRCFLGEDGFMYCNMIHKNGVAIMAKTAMRPIPMKLRKQINANPYYQVCARKSAKCHGRITWEHTLIYAGRQINEDWAIIPLCWYHHLGDGLNKRLNEYIALRNATKEELEKYPRVNWQQMLDKLIMQDGVLMYDVILLPGMAWEKTFFNNYQPQ